MGSRLTPINKKCIAIFIKDKGINHAIDFYLDLIIESRGKVTMECDYNYWLQSLEYCRLKLLTDEFLKEPPF